MYYAAAYNDISFHQNRNGNKHRRIPSIYPSNLITFIALANARLIYIQEFMSRSLFSMLLLLLLRGKGSGGGTERWNRGEKCGIICVMCVFFSRFRSFVHSFQYGMPTCVCISLNVSLPLPLAP